MILSLIFLKSPNFFFFFFAQLNIFLCSYIFHLGFLCINFIIIISSNVSILLISNGKGVPYKWKKVSYTTFSIDFSVYRWEFEV